MKQKWQKTKTQNNFYLSKHERKKIKTNKTLDSNSNSSLQT